MKYRMQWDEDEQQKLNCCGREFDPKEDLTRQELAPETDLNTLLRRYQPYELPQGQTFYGERDYSLEAADAINQLRELREQAVAKWGSMSDAERAPYPSLGHFLTAVEGKAAVSPSLETAGASPKGAAAEA